MYMYIIIFLLNIWGNCEFQSQWVFIRFASDLIKNHSFIGSLRTRSKAIDSLY